MSRKRAESQQNRYRYQYFVGDYDRKQYVKTVFKRPAVFVFLEQTQDFLGRSQLRNQGEGASPPKPSHLEKLSKIQTFKHVLDFT